MTGLRPIDSMPKPAGEGVAAGAPPAPTNPLTVVLELTWADLMPSERAALCALAYIGAHRAQLRWSQLTPREHHQLAIALRRAIDLGQTCALALMRMREGLGCEA